MKIIINAPFTEKDFIKLGLVLREIWKDKKENCHVLVEEGFEGKSKEEMIEIIRKIFALSPEYHEIVITDEIVEEFHRKIF